jgi:arylsulfatase A-like enzyme
VYGEPEAPPTPHFDAFAAEGLLFTDAVTPMPETAPAHASLFTRLHPLRHGVVSNGDRLSRGFYTLAEHLWFEGWTTGAFVSSFAVDSRTGLDQGFSVYDDGFFPFLHGFSDLRLASLGIRALMRFGDPLRFPFLLERPAPDTLERALRWMELQQAEGRPFFCWVHFFEPHSPYEAHPESPGSDARPPAVDHRWILANEKGFDYSEEVVAELRRLYREEALYTDHQLGRLLEGLEALGVADRTLVVVMADHGEMLGEHGYHFHHHGLYEDALRIPLALRFPGLAPGVETRQARTMDVPVTLEKALRLTPTEPHEGRDLVEMHLDAEARGPSVTLIGRRGASLREGSLYGLRTGRSPSGTPLKYLLEHDTRREELYDLEADPEEREDLSISQPRVVERSRGLVEEELRARKERNDGGRDAAVMEGLRALGYLE